MRGRKIYKYIKMLAIMMASFVFYKTSYYVAHAFPLAKNDLCLTVVARNREYVFYYPEIDYYQGVPYLKNAQEVVDGIFYDTISKPIDAEVLIFPDRDYPFEFVDEKYGRAIDKEDLLIKIDGALRQKKQKVIAKEVVIFPEYTVEKLRKSTYRLGCFTTNYTYSSEERKENIKLCAKIIGGVRLDVSQEFSFNKVVGERTEDRGFKSARIIENGKFVDGIGGGVCQVSSTVYNAVLESGLKIVERHAHSMAVSYVEPSFDAMVSMGYADLRFVNNTNGTIFLTANVQGDCITIKVYGQKSKFSYKRVCEVTEKIDPPEYLRTKSDKLQTGEERIVVYEKQGLKSKGFLEVYKNGLLVDKVLISSDSYAPLQGEIFYG